MLQKRIFAVLCTLVLFCGSSSAQNNPHLTVLYPKNDDVIFTEESTFVYGNVTPRDALVRINGQRARVYSNGTFMAYVPVDTGRFSFRCQAIANSDTTEVIRKIWHPIYLKEFQSNSAKIDTSFIFPQANLQVASGEKIALLIKGSPGCRVACWIDGYEKPIRLREKRSKQSIRLDDAIIAVKSPLYIPNIRGVYYRIFKIPPALAGKTCNISYRFTSGAGKKAEELASGKLSVFDADTAPYVRIGQELRLGKRDEEKAPQFYFAAGVTLKQVARVADWIRVQLADDEFLWIPEGALSSRNTDAAISSSDLYVARSKSYADKVQLRVLMRERLPMKISQSADELSILFYGVRNALDWLRQDFSDPLIDKIRGERIGNKNFKMTLSVSQKMLWGYRANYAEQTLILELLKTPISEIQESLSLNNLLICIDPGHAPDEGAIGATGVLEREVTLKYAQTLKKMLENAGADVLMTRSDTTGINLASRMKLADAADADLFVSIHFNSLPDGIEPFNMRGTSTYYYTPQSRLLAEAIHANMLKRSHLPDFGLHQRNLAVCRISSMPAVLIEPAFLMLPPEEMKILNPEFEEAICEGVMVGIKEFLQRAREQQ